MCWFLCVRASALVSSCTSAAEWLGPEKLLGYLPRALLGGEPGQPCCGSVGGFSPAITYAVLVVGEEEVAWKRVVGTVPEQSNAISLAGCSSLKNKAEAG